jgi:hypothetical protein
LSRAALLEHAAAVADADAPEAWGADGGHRRIADEVFAIKQVFENGLEGDGGADLMANGEVSGGVAGEAESVEIVVELEGRGTNAGGDECFVGEVSGLGGAVVFGNLRGPEAGGDTGVGEEVIAFELEAREDALAEIDFKASGEGAGDVLALADDLRGRGRERDIADEVFE